MVDANGGARPTAVKIDCEGCEWPSLAQMARETPHVLSEARLLFLEAHVGNRATQSTSADEFSSAWQYLTQTLGFKLWYLRENPGWPDDRMVPGRPAWLQEAGLNLTMKLSAYELAFAR